VLGFYPGGTDLPPADRGHRGLLLFIVWNLVLGAWNLVLGAWNLVLGAWNLVLVLVLGNILLG